MFIYADFFTRVEDGKDFDENLYRKKITSGPTDEKSAYLFEDCFSNHVNYHDYTRDKLVFNNQNQTRYINQDILSAYFINKIYEIPNITDVDHGCPIDFDRYLNDVMDSSFTEDASGRFNLGSNRLRYVVGEVGTGKSAFLKKLICEIQKKQSINNGAYKLVIVYTNLEENYNYGIEPVPLKSDFLVYLFRKIALHVEDQIHDFDAIKIASINPDANSELAIKRLLSELKDQGIRILIFIDNLDFYHYFYSRYSMFSEYNKNQIKSVHENIMWLISTFSSAGALGHCGLNVVIAARPHIYEEIACNNQGVNTGIDTSRAITLKIPSEETVVSTRLKLLAEATDIVVKEKEGAGKILKLTLAPLKISLLKETSEEKELRHTPIGVIYKLGQHGYRSLVHFLSSLSLSYLDVELFERFLGRNSQSLYILYINKMHKLYSQRQDHFPNMFLVDCTRMNGDGFELAHQPHIHTYWLKYFILKFIFEHGEVRLEKILETFVRQGGYEDHLVRHVIGSLCTANEFRCAELEPREYNKQLESRKIKITDRGRAMFAKSYDGIEFCLQFVYLQTILDDQWMSFPNFLFQKMTDSKSDYTYLYSQDPDSYANRTISEVNSKSRKVLIFLSILHFSYLEEIRARKTRLDKILINLNMIPNLEEVASKVVYDARGIAEGVGRPFSTSDMEGILQTRFDLGHGAALDVFFKKYFDSGIKVSK